MLDKKKKDIVFDLVLRVSILALLIAMFCVIPKELVNEDNAFTYIQSAAVLSEDNLIFFDEAEYSEDNYYVESTKFIRRKKMLMKKQNEILVVKIYGEKSITYYDDYIEIADTSIPQYKVEMYLAKNADLGIATLPCKTAILFLKDNMAKINGIFFDIILILFFIGCSISLCLSLKSLLLLIKKE